MHSPLRDKKSPNVFKSFQFAYEGLKYCYNNERNMRIHFFVAILVVLASILFRVSNTEFMIILVMIGLVLTFELINTSIEALVDLVTDEYQPLAKIAKDTAAAGVMIFAFISSLVGMTIFVPKILKFISQF